MLLLLRQRALLRSHVRSISSSTTVASGRNGDAAATRRAPRRSERLQTTAIEGTAPFYTRQLMVVDAESSAPRSWPKKLEFSDHVLASYVAAALPHVQNIKESPLTIIAGTPFGGAGTCADGEDDDAAAIASLAPEQADTHDLIIFPEQIRVKDVTATHVPTMVAQLLQPEVDMQTMLQQLQLTFDPLATGHHVLVCAHEQRDFRCGCNGPKLLEWLDAIAADRCVPMYLYSASHFGGHRYAANCITYPGGDWFGLLNERADAESLVEALVMNQPLRLRDQWRGRIALTKEDQIRLLQDAQ